MSGVRRSALTPRATALSAMLSVIYTVVNTYLNVNFGMGFGFSAITIFLAYGLFHKLGRGSDRRELASCVVAAGMALPVGWTLSFIIFASEELEGFSLPRWLVPPSLGHASQSASLWAWAVPLTVLFAISFLSAATGLVVAYATWPLIEKAGRLVFPFYRAPAAIINACLGEGGRGLKLVAKFMALGFSITLAQYLLEALGVPATLIDLSPLLPPGFVVGAALSLTFLACGFMIGTAVSLSMLASSLLAFALITPLLVWTGALQSPGKPMELYMAAVMGYLISPALGMMLLGGILVSLFKKIAKKLAASTGEGEVEAGEGDTAELKSLSYGELFSYFFRTLAARKKLLALYLAILTSTALLAYLLNPLAPLSPLLSTAIALLAAVLLTTLDYAILVKMAGELGMTSGTHQFWLYAAPVLATGYKGYTPYVAMPGQGSWGSWEGTLIAGYSKAMKDLGLSAKDVIKARLVCWLPSFLASAAFVFFAWRAWGLPSPQMPCVNLMLGLPLVRMVAERRISGIIDPLTFAVGAIAGALLEALTPVSMMGLALGLVLPPYYAVPFAIGGLLRAYLERKRGREWCRREGLLAASALIASSVLGQVAGLVLMLLAR